MEEAAKKEAETVNALGGEFPPNPLDMELIKTIFIHGAKWQKKQDDKLLLDHIVYKKGKESGMRYMKQQMMKDAIEGMVEEPKSLWWRIISDDLEGEFVVKNNLHDEDRVKMIIIKEK